MGLGFSSRSLVPIKLFELFLELIAESAVRLGWAQVSRCRPQSAPDVRYVFSNIKDTCEQQAANKCILLPLRQRLQQLPYFHHPQYTLYHLLNLQKSLNRLARRHFEHSN